MSSIIGFFDGNTLRAVNIEGLLVKNNNTNYWQMKNGTTIMPFPNTIHLLKDRYVTFVIHCVASKHVSINYTQKNVLYNCPGESKGKIVIYKNGPNVHTVEFDGFLYETRESNWGLRDPKNISMPLGIAFKNAECRLVEIEIESIYKSMPSILNCNKRVLYP